MFRQFKLRNYPFLLTIYVVALTILGILLVGSAKHSVMNKQILGFGLGVLAMLFVAMFDYSWLLRFCPFYYVVVNGLLIYVKFWGKSSGGAQRWIKLPGGFQLQPSELAKVMMIIFFAWLLMLFEGEINRPKNLLICMIAAAIPLYLILQQPDTSTTIVCTFILVILLFTAGLSYKIIFGVIGTAIPLFFAGIVYLYRNLDYLYENYYQVRRIMSWIDPAHYSDTALQQQRSIMAIATGQLFGKGLNNTIVTSMKNSNYIIEPQTDFIFAVAGEELGFAGCMVIILLLGLIVLECIIIGIRAKDLSGRLICCGTAAWISFQAFVNLCVATGLMPNTGVTLPFVSYGLTSTVSLYIILGFVVNVALQPDRNKRGGLFQDQ